MQILLSCAKNMDRHCGTWPHVEMSEAMFAEEARRIALAMLAYDEDALCEMFKVSPAISRQNHLRYMEYGGEGYKIPAGLAFSGMAFKHLDARGMDAATARNACRHLWITSMMYGLLRPCDGIMCHRMEGNVTLAESGGITLFKYWQPLLTDVLIDAVRADDGILLNLASSEMKNLFDWKKVSRSVRVIEPQFMVVKNGKPRTVVVYAKMCRGAMSRYILQHDVHAPKLIDTFDYEGFTLSGAGVGETDTPLFLL